MVLQGERRSRALNCPRELRRSWNAGSAPERHTRINKGALFGYEVFSTVGALLVSAQIVLVLGLAGGKRRILSDTI